MPNASFFSKQVRNQKDDTDQDKTKKEYSCKDIATLRVLLHVFIKFLRTSGAWCLSVYKTVFSSYFLSLVPMQLTIASAASSFASTPHDVIAPTADILGFKSTSLHEASFLWILFLYHLYSLLNFDLSGRNLRLLFNLCFSLRCYLLLLLWSRLVICHLTYSFYTQSSISDINTI